MQNIETLRNSDTLFYYTNRYTGLEKILSSMQLRFSKLIDTNDPYEYKALNFPFSQWIGANDNSFENAKKVDKELNSLIKERTKVLCFCRNSRSQYYGYEKSRMWSQYGSNHRRLCIAISKNNIRRELKKQLKDETYFFEPVIYKKIIASENEARFVDDSILKEGSGIIDHIKNYYKQIYFTKNIDYKDENEYRLVVLEKDNIIDYISIKNSLKVIILGDAFPKVYYPIIQGICEEYSVGLYINHYESGEGILLNA